MKYMYEGKEVEANVIDSHADYNPEGGLEIRLVNGETRNASAPMTAAYKPKSGDYYVEGEEGHSLMSKEEFESKYLGVHIPMTDEDEPKTEEETTEASNVEAVGESVGEAA